MTAPEIVDCEIVPRKTTLTDGKTYAFTEIHMRDKDGRHYCSRTWEQLRDDNFMRAHLIEQFKRRWEADERAKAVAKVCSKNPWRM